MSNILTYRNYSAAVEFDAEDQLFFGRIAGIADGVTFHAETVPELVAAFYEAVDDYLKTCVKLGKTPEPPLFRQAHAAHRFRPARPHRQSR